MQINRPSKRVRNHGPRVFRVTDLVHETFPNYPQSSNPGLSNPWATLTRHAFRLSFFFLLVDERLWVPRQSAEFSANTCIYSPSYPRLRSIRRGYIDHKKYCFKTYASREGCFRIGLKYMRPILDVDWVVNQFLKVPWRKDKSWARMCKVFVFSDMSYYICNKCIYIRQYNTITWNEFPT